MDKKKVFADKVLGYGIVDLDPAINLKKQNSMKLSSNGKPVSEQFTAN